MNRLRAIFESNALLPLPSGTSSPTPATGPVAVTRCDLQTLNPVLKREVMSHASGDTLRALFFTTKTWRTEIQKTPWAMARMLKSSVDMLLAKPFLQRTYRDLVRARLISREDALLLTRKSFGQKISTALSKKDGPSPKEQYYCSDSVVRVMQKTVLRQGKVNVHAFEKIPDKYIPGVYKCTVYDAYNVGEHGLIKGMIKALRKSDQTFENMLDSGVFASVPELANNLFDVFCGMRLQVSVSREDVLNLLKALPVDVLNDVGSSGLAALHFATFFRQWASQEQVVTFMEALLAAGVQIDVKSGEGYGWADHRIAPGSTPLIIAAGYGSIGTMEFLLKRGADINAADDYGLTALHAVACMANFGPGYVAKLKLLLEQKNIDVNLPIDDGSTALDLASTVEAKALLRAKGGQPGVRKMEAIADKHESVTPSASDDDSMRSDSGSH